MRTVFLASLRIHIRRYVAAAIAVTVAVTFAVVVGVLTSGARSGLMDGLGAPYRNADHVVSPAGWPSAELDAEAVIAFAERHGENASAIGRATLPARAGGRRLSGTTVGPITTSEGWRWQELSSGRFPARTGEAVVDVYSALAADIAVGDRVRIGEGAAATDVRVVGLVESPSPPAQASVYVTWPQLLKWRDHLHLGSVAVRGEVGQLPEGAKVLSPEAFTAERLTYVQNRVDSLSVMLLLFVGIALFVAVLVIANTFSILFAQRLRDFALLRCVGATRRQVVRSVRREAAVVGVLASLTGTLVGIGLGYGLIALISALAPTVPMGAAELPTLWLLGGFAVGLVVTMVASWLPTRRVVRVSPLAALRPDGAVDVHTATGLARLALAALLLVTGPTLLGVAMVQGSTALMLGGGGSVFAGVLLFGPVLVPRLVWITGALLGPAGRLATKNAVRNPRRTATTTASLLVGVTLTTAVLTGMATWRTSLDEQIGRDHPIDVALTSPEGPVTTDLLNQVRRTTGVERAVPVDGATARVSGLDGPIPVVTAPAAEQVARDGGVFARVEPGKIRIDSEAFDKGLSLRPGGRVTVRVGDRRAQLQVAVGTGWGPAGVVAPETLATLTDAPEPHAIWIRASPGADPAQLSGDLDELADPVGATIENGLRTWESLDRQLGIYTWSALGLLGIAVVIALIGIANTLGLSVLERAREHAMLRALGLTRRQLRRMLATEAVLLSVVAALLGTVIGVGFAWVGYETLVKRALSDATMQIPWPSLGVVVLTAALAGLLAAVLPARRAARVTPAAGLSLD
ncbi:MULTISPECIES: ABC transporter permease [Streptosporangium]|uniref:ABC transport system permease protein n=1 Tax=Streptosporangium brasiliense TaxID=47480 RepID=A0ABT9RIT9_9ACTN|nr:ABC transporter permease [Streptosporangium brasiliense]MDP9869218.1 putative ABC transport system permease protein [Streptosporangium brasiliense]